jgi:hypothetical protein
VVEENVLRGKGRQKGLDRLAEGGIVKNKNLEHIRLSRNCRRMG